MSAPRLLCAARAQVTGQPLWQTAPFAAGEAATLTRACLDRAYAGEHVMGVELTVRTRRGTGLALQLNASPMADGGLVLVGVPNASEE